MWEHLDSGERNRRLQRLVQAATHGGSDWEAFSPESVIGALAYQDGDGARALEIWAGCYPDALGSGELDDSLVDSAVLWEAAQDENNWEAICTNVMAPPELLRQIWDEGGSTAILAEHPGLPVDLLDDLTDEEPEVLLGAARNVSIPLDKFDDKFGYVEVDEWRPFSELEVTLRGNACVPDGDLLYPPLDEEWIETWSSPGDEVFYREDIEIKCAQVRHPAIPLEVLKAHVFDVTPEVRAAAAGNPRMPQEVLIGIALDPTHVVRAAVRANSAASEEIKAAAAILSA
jgi:hypothetical protein